MKQPKVKSGSRVYGIELCPTATILILDSIQKKSKQAPPPLSGELVKVTPRQRVVLGMALRRRDKAVPLPEVAVLHHATVKSMVDNGLMRFEGCGEGFHLRITDRGQLGSNQSPPVEVMLKEL